MYRDKYEPDRVVRVSARNFGTVLTGDVEGIPLYAVGCLADDVAMRRGANEGMGSWAPTA